MKITTQTRRVNPQRELLACFDVSKTTLNLFCRYEQDQSTVRLEDQLPNATGPIEQTLGHLQRLAQREGFEAARVLCESTGGYERALLMTARRLGCRTALVNPEHVCRLRKVESNDTGKTDHKDPRVIDLVARLGKTQRHLCLPEIYQMLRRLTSFYDQEEELLAAIRTRIGALIVKVFPDYESSGLWRVAKRSLTLSVCTAASARIAGTVGPPEPPASPSGLGRWRRVLVWPAPERTESTR